MLLKNLSAHVSTIGIGMMINGIPEHGDSGLTNCEEGLSRIVANPPFPIGETLKQERYLLRSSESTQSLHHAATNLPGRILSKGGNSSNTRLVVD